MTDCVSYLNLFYLQSKPLMVFLGRNRLGYAQSPWKDSGFGMVPSDHLLIALWLSTLSWGINSSKNSTNHFHSPLKRLSAEVNVWAVAGPQSGSSLLPLLHVLTAAVICTLSMSSESTKLPLIVLHYKLHCLKGVLGLNFFMLYCKWSQSLR